MMPFYAAALGLLLVLPFPLFAEEKSSGWLAVISRDFSAPLGAWRQVHAFDTADKCEGFVSHGMEIVAKGKFDDGSRIQPGSLADDVRSGAVMKCVPADRSTAPRPSASRNRDAYWHTCVRDGQPFVTR
jgi:hypothetical protein